MEIDAGHNDPIGNRHKGKPLHHGLEPVVRRAGVSQKASAVGGGAWTLGRIGILGDAKDGIERVEETFRAMLPEDIGERIDVGLW